MPPKPAWLRPDALVAILLLLFAAALWLEAGSLPQSRLGGGVGAEGLPKVLAALLAFLSIVLLVQTLIAAPDADIANVERGTVKDHVRAAGILGIGVLVLLALPVFGYAPTVALLLVAMAVFHGRRLSAKLVLSCALGAVGFHLLFVELLSVNMPAGFWPELLAR